MSQPRPRPCSAISRLNVVIPRTRTMSNSSARLWSKCSHSAVLTSTPALVSSASRNFFSSGTQLPQPVPALVHVLTAGDVGAAVVRDRRSGWRPW